MINFVCGLYGNAWYLSHAEGAIARARQEGLVGDQLLMTLMRRGGTSWLGLFGMWLLTGLVGAFTAIFLLVLQLSPVVAF